MGLFDRLSTMLRSNINDLISRAENPEKMLNQLILDMKTQLAKAKQQVASAIADEKKLQSDAEALKKQAEDWERRAMMAVQEGRDDLAKQALGRYNEQLQSAQQLHETWVRHKAETEQLKLSLRQLNDKIEEAKRKKNILVARSKRAEAQQRIQETMSGLSDKSAFESFERMAEKIEATERKALAAAELNEEVSGDLLARQFEALEYKGSSDQQLHRAEDQDGDSELRAGQAGLEAAGGRPGGRARRRADRGGGRREGALMPVGRGRTAARVPTRLGSPRRHSCGPGCPHHRCPAGVVPRHHPASLSGCGLRIPAAPGAMSRQRWLCAAAVTLTVGGLVGVVFLIAPAVSAQVQDLIANLPQFLSELDQSINRLFRSIPVLRRGVTEGGAPGLLATSLNELFGFLRGAAVPYLKGGLELIIVMVSVLVMALYLSRSPATYVEGVVALVPPARRPLARVILDDLKLTLHSWVVGQIIAMVVLAALTTLGLWILGVPYFLAFGIFAGVAAIVPFFGTLFSTLIPALYALGVAGFPKAVAVTAAGHRRAPHRSQLRRAAWSCSAR